MAQSPQSWNWEEGLEQKRIRKAFSAPQAPWEQVDCYCRKYPRQVPLSLIQNRQLYQKLFLLDNPKKFKENQQVFRLKK